MGKRYIAEDGSPIEPPMHPFRTSRGGAQRRLVATSGDLIFQSLSTIVAFSVLGLLALIAAILFVAAEESVRTFGFGFLGGTVWDPVSQVFGAAPFTCGMLVTSALALVLAVPDTQREAALSLGATRWETTRLAVLRYARAGIFGAVVLGLGRAVGETMAVTMTIGNRNAIFTSLFDPGQTISSLIANNWLEAGSLELSALIELGLVLMLVSLLINAFARLMVGRVLHVGEGAE